MDDYTDMNVSPYSSSYDMSYDDYYTSPSSYQSFDASMGAGGMGGIGGAYSPSYQPMFQPTQDYGYQDFGMPSSVAQDDRKRDMNPMYAALLKGGLDLFKSYQQNKAMKGDVNARKNAMEWYKRFLSNPQSMYEKDPALRAARAQRLADVGAGAARAAGGTRGAAYQNAMMRQGAAIDAANAQQLGQQYMGLISATQPAYAANAQMGGVGGALGSAATNAIDYYLNQSMRNKRDDQFMSMMDRWKSGSY